MNNLQNPLESVFNMGQDDSEIDDRYEMAELPVEGTVQAPTEAPPDHKDADDVLVEKRIDEVYDMAMLTFQNQTAYTEIIEPRYAARNAEVAANYLNIALAAANSRAKVKTDRKRANQVFIPHSPGKTTNNLVIADRNDILKMINVDSSVKEIK